MLPFKMKNYLLCAFLFLILKSNAQIADSIVLPKPDNLHYKHFIIPAVFISGGLILLKSGENKILQSKIQAGLQYNFRTRIDDYTQFAPIIQVYGARFLGLKSKNTIKQQTINLVVANLITGGVIFGLKKTFKETRPDLSSDNSFPSGHTATAFTNASILFYEYKDSNIWYASSGYLFATATGVLRIANNRHFASDVLAGAGIGIGIGFVVSYWSPFQSFTIGKNKKTNAFIYPQIGENYGVGLLIRN